MSTHARRYSRIRERRGAKAAGSYKPRHRRVPLGEAFRRITELVRDHR